MEKIFTTSIWRNPLIMYKNIDIESSYKKNDLGKTLYDLVIKYKPFNLIEFGSLYGYSTIAMAMALRDLGRGKLYHVIYGISTSINTLHLM